ncbi:bacteriocin immunity protein [Chitinophaga eiseniae]|nr:bacteriocin immunity protein [Chitinophaga eiseniae]
MKEKDIDRLIIDLGRTLLTNEELFEERARQEAENIGTEDLAYLQQKLHQPPQVPLDINVQQLGLGAWLSICQYAIFELVYQLDVKALHWLKSIAFGEYDWTQATALEIIYRLYIDGKVQVDIVAEIEVNLDKMRYETLLYLAQGLSKRKERDHRFHGLIRQIKNIDFCEALTELTLHDPMTREELIDLGNKIITADGSEEKIQQLMEIFDRNVPHPDGSSLFFYPENYNAKVDDISIYDPTAEEVVDKCLSYKPING